jgi:hypothetical protein
MPIPGSPLSIPLAWNMLIREAGNLLTGVSGNSGWLEVTMDGVLEELVIRETPAEAAGATLNSNSLNGNELPEGAGIRRKGMTSYRATGRADRVSMY